MATALYYARIRAKELWKLVTRYTWRFRNSPVCLRLLNFISSINLFSHDIDHGLYDDLNFGQPAIIWASLTMALLTLPTVVVASEEALATEAGYRESRVRWAPRAGR